MYLGERLWASVTSILSIVTLSPLHDGGNSQSPLRIASDLTPQISSAVGVPDAPNYLPETPDLAANVDKGPRFPPPGGSEDYPFRCEYPRMEGFEMCSTRSDRKCWLRRPSDGKQYDIFTNYEEDMPLGVTRYYELELKDSSWDADGMDFTAAKLFNNEYPGPWIQACWGDTIVVNVTNQLQYNGTSVHWHGIRQNQTMHMDGVNGITQCPISPGDHFVYRFNATQYGSSWYHSHYSVQYADGAVGGMTIHGPSSSEWDEAISPPLIMTDWGHNSAFEAVSSPTGLLHEDILLNGLGNVTKYNNGTANTTAIKGPYSITFEGPKPGRADKKYLLRIINTSFDSTFVFSIDNHNLTIVSSDFVPIQPYTNNSILIGIGQRYNVIVDANPLMYNSSSPLPTDGNYWIRTYVSPCGPGQPSGSEHYEETGILRYNSSSKAEPSSQPWQGVSKDCSDETYTSLHPIVQWTVDPISKDRNAEQFSLWRDGQPPNPPFPLAKWTLGSETDFTPIRINYSDPTFFHFDNKGAWPPLWRIIPENYTSKDWVYFVIEGLGGGFGAHPLHLHGHDFALLEQAYNKRFSLQTMTLKYDNPPRRDVVLLPRGGYVVIAFRADNPGAWLLHCHIAFHISEGLGLQILERQDDADHIWPKGKSPALVEAGRVCQNWEAWQYDRTHWANPPGPKCHEEDPVNCFQDDSGV